MIFVIIDSADSNITYNIIDLEFTSLSSYRTQQNIYLLALLSFLFIIVIFVVVKESKEMVKPIQTLSEASHQMMRGDLDTDIKTEYRDEMGGLYKDFDKLRQTLKDNRVERERMAKDREEYIAGITHDLKTPLTSILGFSKGLLDGVAYTKEKTKKYLTVIYDTALHMNGLIEKLKDFSSLDSEKLEFKFERTNIVDFVNSFVSKTALQYMAKDVTVTSRMGIPLISQESSLNDFICMIDVEEFTRVLSNIINNTAKYKHAGMAYSEIVVSRGDGQVIITIKDDGPGVKEKELESIFDCFYRGDSSRTRPTEGSGLGLYVVAKIVAAHNGTVKAVNDNGLKIIITLPEVKK
jgi:signal transduction histidine kinase